MQIVQDEFALELADLLRSPTPPRERFERLQPRLMRSSERGASLRGLRLFPPFQVMEAAMRDGYDVRVAQQLYGLFSPSRKVRASAWALDRLSEADVFGQAQIELLHAAAMLDPAMLPSQLQLAIFPGDPSNRNLMLRNGGLSVYCEGDALAVTVWPSPGNLRRVVPALVRAFVLGCRWATGSAAQRYTLADALEAEGYAAAIVAQRFPMLPHPWLAAHVAPPAWTEDLQAVAELYGTHTYERVPANVYGLVQRSADNLPPPAEPLDSEELAYAQALAEEMAHSDDPRSIAAFLYGDTIIAEQGHPQIGLSPYAGFQIAYRQFISGTPHRT